MNPDMNGRKISKVFSFVPEKHVRKRSATDGTKLDLNIGETRGFEYPP